MIVFTDNMIWRIWRCLLNYTARPADSRKTKEMLGLPFREGDKFLQEVANIPVHSMTPSLDSRNITDRLLETLQGKVVLACPKWRPEPKWRYWKYCYWGIALTAVRLYFIPAGMFQLSKTSPLCWRPLPTPNWDVCKNVP